MIIIIIIALPFTAKERFPRMAKITKDYSDEDGKFILKRIFV